MWRQDGWRPAECGAEAAFAVASVWERDENGVTAEKPRDSMAVASSSGWRHGDGSSMEIRR
jgi:hypothetical protein